MSAKNDKNWCAWCGVWSDHTSGSCPDFALHQRKQEEWKLKTESDSADDANERGCWIVLLVVFLVVMLLAALSGICSLITPEISQ